jgi:hypothetical protein
VGNTVPEKVEESVMFTACRAVDYQKENFQIKMAGLMGELS